MNFKYVVAIALLCFITPSLFSQVFMPPSEGYSRQKNSYLTLEDGKEITGTLEKMTRKKGLISSIEVTDSISGKKLKFTPNQVKFMYLPPSGLDKLARGMDFLNDATKWNNQDLDAYRLRKGYVYFEKSEVELKKGTQVLMLQLLNPSFSGKVKVFHDPYANETASVGVAGVTVAGGEDKSYYVKKGNEVAFKLYKKNYDKEFKDLLGDCPTVTKKYGDKTRWSDFEAAVAAHATECK